MTSTQMDRTAKLACQALLSALVLSALQANAATKPTLSFSATPTTIRAGAATRVSWSSTNASHCIASGAWGGDLPASGTRSVVLYRSGTLYLTCKGDGGQAQKSVAITVSSTSPAPTTPAPTVTLSASPNSVASGGRTALTWSTSNATACVASGEWTGNRATAGSESSSPLSNATSNFTLTCSGPGGQ